jgi:NAD-dependent dihydropyrimidine dehydrogenase PreA subunit
MQFDPKAAALLLEDEIRDAILGSVSSAVGKAQPHPKQDCVLCSACIQACGGSSQQPTFYQ